MSNILAIIKIQTRQRYACQDTWKRFVPNNTWEIYVYLSKLVGEIANEVRHNLHEICQIGCRIQITSNTSPTLFPL